MTTGFSAVANISADDLAKLSSKSKSELPGKEKEVKTEFKLHAEEAGQKIDNAVSSHGPCISFNNPCGI